MKCILIIFLFSCLFLKPKAQDVYNATTYPEVGKSCPSFTLKNIEYFSSNEATLSDFKGKWLILDFWNKYCSGCIESFSKLNILMRQFEGQFQFMLVGYQDSEGEISKIYRKCRKILNLQLPCAFDSSLCKRFDIYSAPYIIIIDPSGIVKAITYSLNPELLVALLQGKEVVVPQPLRVHEERPNNYDRDKPLLLYGNGGQDSSFIYRSVITRASPNDKIDGPNYLGDGTSSSNAGKIQVTNYSIKELYKLAFVGQVSWTYGDTINGEPLYANYAQNPIIETQDSLHFRDGFQAARYSLSIIINTPNVTVGKLQNALQRELQNAFGYNARIVVKKMPYFKIVKMNTAVKKIISKGKEVQLKYDPPDRYILRNVPFSKLMAILASRIGYSVPIVDKTNIDEKIDLDIECNWSDIEDVKKALRAVGLNLQLDEKDLKVIIISD